MHTTPTTSRVANTSPSAGGITAENQSSAIDTPIMGNETPAKGTLRKGPNSKTYDSTPSPATLPLKKPHVNGRWSEIEDKKLRAVVKELGGKNWKKISQVAFDGSRTDVQCLHRWQKVLRPGLHKGPWSKQEDAVVFRMIEKVGGVEKVKWSVIAAELPGRLGKQVRERWYNHLDPTLNKGPWTPEEDKMLTNLQKTIGNKWCQIAKMLPGRSENAVKNRWNSAQRRKRQQQRRKENGGTLRKARKKTTTGCGKKRKGNGDKNVLGNESGVNVVAKKKRKVGRKKKVVSGKKGKPSSPCNVAADVITNLSFGSKKSNNVDPAMQLCLLLSNAFENNNQSASKSNNVLNGMDVLHNLHKTASLIENEKDNDTTIDFDGNDEPTTPKTEVGEGRTPEQATNSNRSTPPQSELSNILKMIPDNVLNTSEKVIRRPSLSDNDVSAACLSLISF